MGITSKSVRLGVTEQPGNHVLTGTATEVGLTQNGEVLWSLHVHDADVPGRWVIVDGKFMAAKEISYAGIRSAWLSDSTVQRSQADRKVLGRLSASAK
jgi:hypothetical protein